MLLKKTQTNLKGPIELQARIVPVINIITWEKNREKSCPKSLLELPEGGDGLED